VVVSWALLCSVVVACYAVHSESRSSFEFLGEQIAEQRIGYDWPWGVYKDVKAPKVVKDLDLLGPKREWLSWKKLSGEYGESDQKGPLDSNGEYYAYFGRDSGSGEGIPKDSDYVLVTERNGRVYEITAELSENDTSFIDEDRFKFGALPLFGEVGKYKDLLGEPSGGTSIPGETELTTLQWSFMVGEQPRRTAVVIVAHFYPEQCYKAYVWVAYEIANGTRGGG